MRDEIIALIVRPPFAEMQTPRGVPVNGLKTLPTIDATLFPRSAIASSIELWSIERDGSNNEFSGHGVIPPIQRPAGIPFASVKDLETDDMSIPNPARKPATVSSDAVSRFINNVLPGQTADDTQTPRLSPVESVKFLRITGMEISRADSKLGNKP